MIVKGINACKSSLPTGHASSGGHCGCSPVWQYLQYFVGENLHTMKCTNPSVQLKVFPGTLTPRAHSPSRSKTFSSSRISPLLIRSSSGHSILRTSCDGADGSVLECHKNVLTIFSVCLLCAGWHLRGPPLPMLLSTSLLSNRRTGTHTPLPSHPGLLQDDSLCLAPHWYLAHSRCS